jgi:hypothetical protein
VKASSTRIGTIVGWTVVAASGTLSA